MGDGLHLARAAKAPLLENYSYRLYSTGCEPKVTSSTGSQAVPKCGGLAAASSSLSGPGNGISSVSKSNRGRCAFEIVTVAILSYSDKAGNMEFVWPRGRSTCRNCGDQKRSLMCFSAKTIMRGVVEKMNEDCDENGHARRPNDQVGGIPSSTNNNLIPRLQ